MIRIDDKDKGTDCAYMGMATYPTDRKINLKKWK
jgi:hypothetical protein